MKRTLLLYATREGQTEKVAQRIAAHLKEAGVTVTVICARDAAATDAIDVDAFDQLVFGASMHAGGLESELVAFVNRHAERIERKPYSFFLVLLSAATKDPALKAKWLADARRKMDQQLRVRLDAVEMIAGALKYSRYPLPLKWIMKRIAGEAGEGTDTTRDYEYTDWHQVEEYARKLAAA